MRPEDRPKRGRVQQWRDRARLYLTRDIWSMELGGLPTFRALFYKTSRVLFLGIRGFVKDRCLNRASALTYITVLSLVPLLAFAFSVAKGLGAYETLLNDTVHPFLDQTFGVLPPDGVEPPVAPVPETEGAQGDAPVAQGDAQLATATSVELRRAIDKILQFVQDTNFASVGAFGLLILVYTVVKLLGSVEQSFNDIWGVHKPRGFLRKLSDYLSIVVVVPILLVAATGVSATLQNPAAKAFLTEKLHLGALWSRYVQFLPLLVPWIAFMALYLFMPNTRVRFRSALLGGIVGGTLWQIAQILHLKFQVGMAKYSAIYSTFAAFPIFLFLLYTSWVTVLFGAELAYAHQNEPAYRQIARTREQDHAFKEACAIRAMTRIAVAFLRGARPWRISSLAAELNVPERTLEQIVQHLRGADIVATAEDDDEFEYELLPARDLTRIMLTDVFDALRDKKRPVRLPAEGALDSSVDAALERYESERQGARYNVTMQALAQDAIALEERAELDEPDVGEGEVAAAESV
ncbi:MAG: YihY family inner membrane protein [bacterium]|nr:YihY family inner membrane protein [bacterium]